MVEEKQSARSSRNTENKGESVVLTEKHPDQGEGSAGLTTEPLPPLATTRERVAPLYHHHHSLPSSLGFCAPQQYCYCYCCCFPMSL